MTSHEIIVGPERRIGVTIFYRAVCSCGKYRSRLTEFRGAAESAGSNHAAAKKALDQVCRNSSPKLGGAS